MGSCDSKELNEAASDECCKNTYQNTKFNDMPEWEGEKYKGEGIKKMKGYKFNLNIDKLHSLREEFWNLKTKEKLVWKHIRNACYMDDSKFLTNLVRALTAVNQLGLKPVNDCINHLVDKKGEHFYLPNFLINDPYYEKTLISSSDLKDYENKISIFINDEYENKQTITILNKHKKLHVLDYVLDKFMFVICISKIY